METAHRAVLPGSDWSVWRCVGVRGAGLPARGVSGLALPGAREVAATLADVESVRGAALAGLQSDMSAGRGEHARLREALQRVLRHELPDLDHPALGPLRSAWPRVQSARTAVLEGSDATLQAALALPAFREAMTWQNRVACVQMQAFAAAGGFRRQDRRALEKRLRLASYLQRYCVKNETIGFFGPMGWGRWSDDGPDIGLRLGPARLAERHVRFEHWAIAELARNVSADPALRRHLPVRRLSGAYVQDATLHLPALRTLPLPPGVDAAVPLSPLEHKLWTLADGERPARALCEELAGDHGVPGEAAVLEALDRLCALGALRCALEVPVCPDPERILRSRLEAIADPELRAPALERLNQLEERRRGVRSAAGDPDALERALAGTDATFVKVAGIAATRKGGSAYAGRTVVYEDCVRDLEVLLGPGFWRRLGPPLDLVLRSTRWYTHRIAEQYRLLLRGEYDALARETRCAEVDLQRLLTRALPLLEHENAAPIAAARAELQRRWAVILGGASSFSSEQLRPAVEAGFAAPHPGWRLARYCTPDVLVAARGAGAAARGEYQLLLGELHLFNTLSRAVPAVLHPRPQELLAAREADIAEPTVVPVPSPEHSTSRLAIHLTSSRDVWFACDVSPDQARPGGRVGLGELVVCEATGALQVRTRDGRERFELVEFLGYRLSNLCMSFPPLLPPQRHTPRVTIDGLVVARESWRFPADRLRFAWTVDRPQQFGEAHAWARERGLPRHTFVRARAEPKPFYLDLHSPLLVRILGRLARVSAEVDTRAEVLFTEMAPDLEHLWLHDADGEHYTSELRIVALDPCSP